MQTIIGPSEVSDVMICCDDEVSLQVPTSSDSRRGSYASSKRARCDTESEGSEPEHPSQGEDDDRLFIPWSWDVKRPSSPSQDPSQTSIRHKQRKKPKSEPGPTDASGTTEAIFSEKLDRHEDEVLARTKGVLPAWQVSELIGSDDYIQTSVVTTGSGDTVIRSTASTQQDQRIESRLDEPYQSFTDRDLARLAEAVLSGTAKRIKYKARSTDTENSESTVAQPGDDPFMTDEDPKTTNISRHIVPLDKIMYIVPKDTEATSNERRGSESDIPSSMPKTTDTEYSSTTMSSRRDGMAVDAGEPIHTEPPPPPTLQSSSTVDVNKLLGRINGIQLDGQTDDSHPRDWTLDE